MTNYLATLTETGLAKRVPKLPGQPVAAGEQHLAQDASLTRQERDEREWHARRRTRLAWHEGAHALAAVVVGVPLQAASLRPGRGFSAVTLLGPAAGDLGREK